MRFLQILWDPKEKKWINKDEDASEVDSFKPPPKMGMNKSMPPQQDQVPPPMQHPGMYQSPAMPPAQTASAMLQSPIAPVQQMHAMPSQPIQPMPITDVSPMQSVPVATSPGPAVTAPPPNMFKMQKSRSKSSITDLKILC